MGLFSHPQASGSDKATPESFDLAAACASVGDQGPAAVGTFVHVFVDRDSRRPVPIPDDLRAALAALQPDMA